MCLVVFAWQAHPDCRLVLVANRDERHDRPTRDMDWWPEAPRLLAGRDLEAGGTWLAMSRDGRFATVTNYREQPAGVPGGSSRGGIVTDFVLGDLAPEAFAGSLDGGRYAGVNVLVSDGASLCYVSNRNDGPTVLSPGLYGLSNAALDTPWSKLVRARDGLAGMIGRDDIDASALSGLLADRTPAPEPERDAGDLPAGLARAVSAPFIVSPDYGTRSTTVIIWSTSGHVSVLETGFDAAGETVGRRSFDFEVDQPEGRS